MSSSNSLLAGRESVRKVDLAALFGCLADAGDSGIAALQSELKSSVKEADGCLDDILHQVPSWLESRGVAVPMKPTVMTAPLLNPSSSVPADSLCCSSMNDESEEDLSRGNATGGPPTNATASMPIPRSPGDKLLSIGNHSVFNDQSSCSAAAVVTIGGAADTQRSRVKDLASKFEAKKLSAAPHHITRTNTTASMSASVKRQMNRGYFPDASPSVDDPPTPVWAKGRKSIAEMMDGNEDNVSPIAGQKGSGMDLDVKRAVESLPSEYEVSKVFSTPIPPTAGSGHSDADCDNPSHEDVGSGRRVLLSTTVSKNTARITITGGKVKRLRSLDSPPRFDDQYAISEYDEDTDEHSEDARHKHIPAWSMKWQSMVLAQSSTDPDSIFGDRIPSCDIRQVFGDIVASGQLDPPNTQSFKDYIRINDKTGRRGSTGNWKFDELLDEEIYTYKQKMNQNIKAENVFVDCSPDADVDGSVLDEESNICMP